MEDKRGTVTIGIEYYTDLVREHAIMEEQIHELKRFCKSETSKLIYVKEVAKIFGFDVGDPGYQE